MRLEQSHESKKDDVNRVAEKGIKKKKRNIKKENLAIDQVKLLEEARSWSADQKINWSQLARNYGLTDDNGGQIIKEFLAEYNIAAAMTVSSQVVRRHKLRLPGGEISYPTHATVKFQKNGLQKRLDEGEYYMGDPISNAEYTVYDVD
jgi:hypothetical protein